MQVRLLARLFSMLILPGLVVAQEPVKTKLNSRIMTGTRQVATFTSLETQVLTAVQKKDKAGLQAMLTDDFGIEMPDASRLSSEEWMDSIMSRDFTLKKFGVRQVSVSDLGNAAVVKFDRLQQSTLKNTADDGEFFVVDLWKKDGDTWKLASRYVSKVSSVVPAQKDVKPTGKQ
jgi:Domain of unknown function (DUF4440)